jgi:hypothetical protein
MKSSPKIGTTGETRFVVETKHCIEFATDGMPPVLSTPNLIGILERTARQAIAPFLAADERSVGWSWICGISPHHHSVRKSRPRRGSLARPDGLWIFNSRRGMTTS